MVIFDRLTGKSRGFGFVTYHEPTAAQAALCDPNPLIDGRRINVNLVSWAEEEGAREEESKRKRKGKERERWMMEWMGSTVWKGERERQRDREEKRATEGIVQRTPQRLKGCIAYRDIGEDISNEEEIYRGKSDLFFLFYPRTAKSYTHNIHTHTHTQETERIQTSKERKTVKLLVHEPRSFLTHVKRVSSHDDHIGKSLHTYKPPTPTATRISQGKNARQARSKISIARKRKKLKRTNNRRRKENVPLFSSLRFPSFLLFSHPLPQAVLGARKKEPPFFNGGKRNRSSLFTILLNAQRRGAMARTDRTHVPSIHSLPSPSGSGARTPRSTGSNPTIAHVPAVMSVGGFNPFQGEEEDRRLLSLSRYRVMIDHAFRSGCPCVFFSFSVLSVPTLFPLVTRRMRPM